MLRQFIVSTALVAFCGVASAADMTSREVTALLFGAKSSSPVDLSGKDLSGLDLAGLDFSGARLERVNFQGADLTGAKFVAAKLAAARLDRATLIRADFTEADLTGASLLRPNNFSDLENALPAEAPVFDRARLAKANLNGRFDWVSFRGADLSETFFGPRDPREEVLITPMMELRGADFSDAKMIRADLALNALESAKFVRADLTSANLRGARLGGADLSGANVDKADFTGATLEGARLDATLGRDTAIGLQTRR